MHQPPAGPEDWQATFMLTPRFLPRWMVYLLFALSLSAFVYSLQVRHQDWVGVTAEAPQ